VTHQGSLVLVADDLLMANSTSVEKGAVIDSKSPHCSVSRQCHFCGNDVSDFVRYGFLDRRRVPNCVQLDRRGTHYGHSP
jgi:hypothetical protein